MSKIDTYQKNLSINKQEISKGLTTLESFPLHLGLVFGFRCNLNCVMCGQKTFLKTHFNPDWEHALPDTVIKDVLSFIPLCDTIGLSGGEPLYYSHTKRVIDVVQTHSHIKISMITNGTLINDYWINRICSGAFEQLSLSIDAATEKTYQSIRVGGNFKTVLEATRRITQNSNRDSPKITWNFVVMKRNYNEILPFIDLAVKYGVDRVSFTIINLQRLNYFRQNILFNKKHAKELLITAQNIEEKVEEYNIEWVDRIRPAVYKKFPEYMPKELIEPESKRIEEIGRLPCYAFWKNMTIGHKSVSSCCWARKKYRHIPINHTNQSILDIWNGERYKEAREYLSSGKYSKVCDELCPVYIKWKRGEN